ncbi:MAG TPA: C40 family peptidase [Candidatus Mediterraneibacter gallistercoris]|uniref:C40 family peptidase n=1 Tax=Candidatus Mediterraneibacter gallistercoris TaxID=2838671 RepID=A0A9D2P6K8_9FIRM|nr:C40 family peptidase [Mediterraneibacter glycyrrhizinilyticus]MBM6752762.1 C40 family peptidase [Mediterraneibacter glycyrrhizinilyticus]HJC44336.1 C40 family peptidase [Candidatus Mediterraneibacter gallistercoris]
MINTHVKSKLIISAFAGLIIIPGSAVTVRAEEEMEDTQSAAPAAGIESVLEECFETEVKENINLYMVPTDEGEYLNIAFSDTGDFTYIRSAPDENSDWVGKLYSNSTAEVLEYLDGWIKIRSGTAEGYVPADTLITGEDARGCAQEYENSTATVTAYSLNVRDGQGTDAQILTQIGQGEEYMITGDAVDGWYPVKVGEIDGWVSGDYIETETSYSYGETREEEEQRIAEEKALEEQQAQEAAAREAAAQQEAETQNVSAQTGSSGQAVIDYACQFIGNPYVWGGTSLTEGADCSGFVQSVYAHFGINLPRTSYDMRSAGYEVSYDEAQPGDLILYDGHVGLYMGDGNIVNAMNEEQGIGICSATYTNIVAVRRVL